MELQHEAKDEAYLTIEKNDWRCGSLCTKAVHIISKIGKTFGSAI
jgi:hypothetical protein